MRTWLAWAGLLDGERSSLDGETGWTLIELLVTMTLLLIALTAVGTTLGVGLRVGKREAERPTALGEVQTGFTRMQREVREAHQMLYASGTVLDVLVYRPIAGGGRQDMRIVYKCDDPSATASPLRQCTRYETPVGTPLSPSDVANPGTVPAGSSSEMVIDRVQNATSTDPVFTDGNGTTEAYSGSGPAPTYIAVAIKVPQKGEYAGGSAASFIFNGGLYFRNLDAKTPGP